jgi:hypothetical protein
MFASLTEQAVLRNILPPLIATVLILAATPCFAGQVQRDLITEKGETHDAPVPHLLEWWTENPLRLDTSGLLLLGIKGKDGKPFTASDYTVEKQVTTLGTLSGHKIVQIILNITPGSRVISQGIASAGGPPAQWKSLLIQQGSGDRYIEIYALRTDQGGLDQPYKSARIYGSGPNAILGTYDPDMGNGGGCSDGYWWFDKADVHEVDFTPLYRAMGKVIPPNATFTPNCWALHPEKSELQTWIQRADAQCHACGGLGEIHATYRIEHGSAISLSVLFTPQ